MKSWLRTSVLISAVLHVTSSPVTGPFANEGQTPMNIEDSSAFDFARNFDFGTLSSQRLVQFEDGLVQSMTEWEKVCIGIHSDLEAI